MSPAVAFVVSMVLGTVITVCALAWAQVCRMNDE